jgi:hypothetical protein
LGAGTPSGTVTFADGTKTLGTSALSTFGVATFTTTTLSVASHSITARYGGDANFTASTSATLTQTVIKDATQTSLATSINPTVFGHAVSFTATVTAKWPGSGSPGGTVTFEDGSTVLATIGLSGGQASFTTSALAAGSHTITAVYGGSAGFKSSTSTTLTQTVNQAASTTAVVSSLNPSISGQAVTFTATVSAVAPGAGTATGTVTFLDGASTLGTASLSGGSAAFTTSSLAVGTHSIKVRYSGDANFTSSTSAVLTQTVNAADSATTSLAWWDRHGWSLALLDALFAEVPSSGPRASYIPW